VLAAAIIHCDGGCDKTKTDAEKRALWAAVCGGLGVFMAIVLLVLRLINKLNGQVGGFISIFLIVWWGAGAGVTTFESPFASSGAAAQSQITIANGYFGAWMAFFSSAYMCFQFWGGSAMEGR